MKEYTIIGNFLYKNKKYELLLDDNQRYFFLEIKNNEYKYISIKEYIELIHKFANKKDIKAILKNEKKGKKTIKLGLITII